MRDSTIRVDYHDFAPPSQSMEEAVLAGLRAGPKTLPSKYFYDERGSRIFEDICRQPEYYPTRTELAILRRHAGEMAAMAGPEAQLVELGAGALEKVGVLLSALERPSGVVALDISGDHLRAAAQELAQQFHQTPVTAICADYTQDFTLPESVRRGGRRIGFFPGSTIGNFSRDEAAAFLRAIKPIMGRDGLFIAGVDLKKDPAILNAAYNDAAGVTAAFNLNLLRHLNAALGADFNTDAFAHRAFFNEAEGRIEMHLESLADQSVTIAGETIAFSAGETIRTEISCKYAVEEFQALASRAGYRPKAVFTDDAGLFSIHVLALS